MPPDAAVDNARVVSMRELGQQTARVMRELLDGGEPLLVTKHGRFIAALVPLAHKRIEEQVMRDMYKRFLLPPSDEESEVTTAEDLLRALEDEDG